MHLHKILIDSLKSLQLNAAEIQRSHSPDISYRMYVANCAAAQQFVEPVVIYLQK